MNRKQLNFVLFIIFILIPWKKKKREYEFPYHYTYYKADYPMKAGSEETRPLTIRTTNLSMDEAVLRFKAQVLKMINAFGFSGGEEEQDGLTNVLQAVIPPKILRKEGGELYEVLSDVKGAMFQATKSDSMRTMINAFYSPKDTTGDVATTWVNQYFPSNETTKVFMKINAISVRVDSMKAFILREKQNN